MEEVTLITGGGTGIGAALTKLISDRYSLKVLIVGRTLENLEETASYNSGIEYIRADISTDEGLDKVINYIIDKKYKVKYLVNNAAVQNLCKLENVTNEVFLNSINTNVKAPLMIVNRMIKEDLFLDKSRILMIDSSSRYNIQKGMGLYGISKAALFTMCSVMQKEFEGKLLVSSLYPGTINKTKTANGMAECKIEEIIELRSRLKDFLKSNRQIRILSPDEAAEFILWVLYETDDYIFINPKGAIIEGSNVLNDEQWDIRDEECYIGCELKAGSKLRDLSKFLGE